MASLSNSEPVAAAGAVTAITALVSSTIGLLISFGVDVSETQKAAIGGFVVAVIAIVALGSSWWARSHVTPVATANKAITEAFHADPKTDPKPTLGGIS